jgi:O-antigen ligase
VAKVTSAAIFGVLKALEFMFLGICLAPVSELSWKKTLSRALVWAVVIEDILVLWQTALQHSVGGLWYFLGERTFSPSTIGISTIRFQNNDFLRAYGSFPHPNVLAYFLLFVLVLLWFGIIQRSFRLPQWTSLILITISSLCLLLTFSRLTIILYGVFLLYFFTTKLHGKIKYISVTVLTLSFSLFLLLFAQRFSLSALIGEDTQNRIELLRIGWDIFIRHVFFGVGVYNFFYYEIAYQHTISPVLLQPIHNVYLWVLVQTGLAGGVVFLLFLAQTSSRFIHKLKEKKSMLGEPFFLLFLGFLIVGIFDHYFLTLQQGQLMTTLLLSFAWTRLKE